MRFLERSFPDATILDPDLIDKRSPEFARFKPRNSRNPSENVKTYCFLFKVAERSICNGHNVFWMQPWSRYAEIDVTLKNLGYFLTNLKKSSWGISNDIIVSQLPFRTMLVEVDVPNFVSKERWINNHPNASSKEICRLEKTLNYFQTIDTPLPYYKLDGTKSPEDSAKKVIAFIQKVLNQPKNIIPKPKERKRPEPAKT